MTIVFRDVPPAPTTLHVTWRGPFAPAQINMPGLPWPVEAGVPYVVPNATASQLAVSSPTWWEFS